jgi:hypothetical protein
MVAKTEGNWFGHGVVKTSVLGPGTRGETHSRATEPEPREFRPSPYPRPATGTASIAAPETGHVWSLS